MTKYYVQDNAVVVNKYAVKYSTGRSSGKIESISEVTQYFSEDLEFNAFISELTAKGIKFEVIVLDTDDILKYSGMTVESDEEARRVIEPAVEEVISDKLMEIKAKCRETIYGGVDVTLSGGETKHFSLTIEDQINLISIADRINSAETDLKAALYHADGEICTFFSKDDFSLIADTASDFIIRQTTYCNSLMAYVKSLKNREDIEAVVYGQELTGDFLENYNKMLKNIVI